MVHIKGLTWVLLWYRKGSQNISCFLKTRQPETCPSPQHNSSMALPVRCSRGYVAILLGLGCTLRSLPWRRHASSWRDWTYEDGGRQGQ